jgi:hypothetical protein
MEAALPTIKIFCADEDKNKIIKNNKKRGG